MRSTSRWLMEIEHLAAPAHDLAPGELRPEPLAQGRDVDAGALDAAGRTAPSVILLRSARPLMMRLTSSSVISTPCRLASCSFRRSSISSSCASFLKLRQHGVAGLALDLLDHVLLQLDGELLLRSPAPPRATCTFFSRRRSCSALVGLRVLDDLRPARLGFGLEVLPAAAGIERQERGALLDLVGGDRLVVDEHDDGLLALAGLAPAGFSALGAAALRGGLAWGRLGGELRGVRSASARRKCRARAPQRRRRGEAASALSRMVAGPGCEGANSTARESYRRAAASAISRYPQDNRGAGMAERIVRRALHRWVGWPGAAPVARTAARQ